MTDNSKVTLGEVIDAVSTSPYRNPKLVLEVGKSYTNAAGLLVTLTGRRVVPRSWNREDVYYFVDTEGLRYLPNGDALKGNRRGLFGRHLRRLTDPAQAVQVGEFYDVHWDDGKSVGHYKVLAVNRRGYDILWSNGARSGINFGTHLNHELSVKTDTFTLDTEN